MTREERQGRLGADRLTRPVDVQVRLYSGSDNWNLYPTSVGQKEAEKRQRKRQGRPTKSRYG